MSRLRVGPALAVAVLLALAAPSAAQQPPGQAADPSLGAVPTDAFAFVSVKVSKLWDNPAAKPFRDWVATQKDGVLESMVGLPFADIDRVTVVAPTLDPRRDDDEPIILVTTREKYADAKVLKALAGGFGDGKALPLTGRAVKLPRGVDSGPFRTVLLANDRTLLFTHSALDEKEAAAVLARLMPRKGDGPLSDALAEAQSHDIVIGVNLSALGPFAERLAKDKEAAPFLVFLKAKTAVLTADVGKTAKGKFVMAFPDADTAKQAAKALEDGMKLAAEVLANHRLGGNNPDPVEKFVFGRFVDVLKNGKVTVDGSNVVAAADVPFADDLAKFAEALPKSLKEHIAERTAQNNMKQLGLGFFNFESVYQRFPSDSAPGGDKAPVMSWRVQILPYIEQDNLYKQLDHTKPWDDPANLKILQAGEMPKVFEHPGRPAPKGHTYFRIFMLPKDAKGKDRPLFKEGERGLKILDITDGTSNTFMIVEAGEAVPWYKPDVLAYDGKLPLPQLGAKDADVFLVVFCDGSVRKLKPSKLGEKTLRALITIAGDETIPDLDK
jgi:hypothetical protein